MAILTLKASPSYKYALCLTARPAPNLLYFKVGPFWPLAPHMSSQMSGHMSSPVWTCLDTVDTESHPSILWSILSNLRGNGAHTPIQET